MKLKTGRLILLLVWLGIFAAADVFAQERAHDAAAAVRSFFADPEARANFYAENPAAFEAEQYLLEFPPHIRKRLEKVVLMILDESSENATRHVDALKSTGPDAAFNSFSPAVQKEIQDIVSELEKDPSFMKKEGSRNK